MLSQLKLRNLIYLKSQRKYTQILGVINLLNYPLKRPIALPNSSSDLEWSPAS